VRRAAAIVLVLMSSAVATAACTGDDDPVEGVVPVDEAMPRVTGESLDGDPVDSGELAGSPYVVNVWATWCAPCEAELPALVDVAGRYDGRVGFLGINYVDDAANARRWQRDYVIPYPSVDDQAGALADDLGFPYLPHTLVVDGAGRLRYRIFGETTAEELSGLLDGLLAEGGVSG